MFSFWRSDCALKPADLPDWTQIVQRIQAGDQAGMDDLYAAFGRGIKFMFSRKLGAQDAEDKVHDTFVILIKAIQGGEVREPERLMAFVRTVVRRQIAGWINIAVQSRRDQVEVDPNFADTRANPEQAVIGTQEKTVMRQMLKEMSDRDVQVLTRFYLDEQTPGEICRDLGLTEKQFQLLKSRAKGRFADLVRRRLRRQQ